MHLNYHLSPRRILVKSSSNFLTASAPEALPFNTEEAEFQLAADPSLY